LKQKYIKIFTVFLLVFASIILFSGCIDIDEKGNINILINIAITQEPYKTTYYMNDTFDPTGLEVTAYYWDNSTKKVTGSLTSPDMSTSGTKTVTVNYSLMSVSFNITVIDMPSGVLIDSISITEKPKKTDYYVNEEFDPDGLIVKAVYNDGSSNYVFGYSLSKPDMNTPGSKTITVNYLGKPASFNITVNPAPQGVSLNSITVTQNPTKTSYYVNEAFNSAGLVVTASYSDNSTRHVTGYSLSTPDMSKTGIKTITVTFESKTATFNITVNAVPQGKYLTSITVTKSPAKNTYYINETFNLSGLVVTANYSNSTSEQVSAYTLSTPNMSTAGTKTITVTFEGKTATFNISVTADEGALGVIIY
jgi:hypothetical protein